MNPEPTDFFRHPNNKDILVSASGDVAYVLPKITIGQRGNEVKVPNQGKVTVRQLVAETFLERPAGVSWASCYALQNDPAAGDALENIQWVGSGKSGEQSTSRLTDKVLLDIKADLDQGISPSVVSKKYVVSKALCAQLKAGTYPRLVKLVLAMIGAAAPQVVAVADAATEERIPLESEPSGAPTP